MAVTTSVHSNAFNFMSFLSNGVDPRTGQYTVSISLPEVKANGLMGPALPLVLAYNPLNNQDSGFGHGWNLQLSQFTPGNQVVSLSSGESLKVTSSDPDSDRLVFQEQKIDSFHLHDLGVDGYRLVHKSGLVEWLQIQGTGDKRVALPVRVQAETGHGIDLQYGVYDGWPMLRTVTDDSGQELLRITRTQRVEILLNPDAGPDGEALARFVMTLSGSENKVASISLPTDNQASWRFEYSLIRGVQCINSVQTPTGAKEQIRYQDNGHLFPSGAKPALPRVNRHTTDPGNAQAIVDVEYVYDTSGRNFLGNGLGITWSDDGLDNLYQYIGDYRYLTTERLMVDGREVRSIEREFNQFHLLTRETTRQGQTQMSVETSYAFEPGKPFYQQPNKCQLPAEVKTSWTDGPTRLRSETETRDYDDHGNLVFEQQATGIVETSTWYPASGAGADCPADPEGFVRWLKDKTVTPAAPAGNAQVLRTVHSYLALPALNNSRLPNWLATRSETLEQVSTTPSELQRTTYSYNNEPGDALQHGRVQSQTQTINGLETVTRFKYAKLDSSIFSQSVLHTEQTLVGFDDEQKTIDLEHSLFTGEPLLNRDDNNVEIRYEYDALRRVTKETVAPDTPWVASRQYSYQLCASENDQAAQTLIDVKGVHTVARFDGLNRVVFEQRDDADTAGQNPRRQIYAALYDAWGNLLEETEYDWLESVPLALTSRYEYDDWNQQRAVTGPDGVRTVEETDPIGSAQSNGPIRRSWREGGGLSSGITETWLNLFDEPARTERKDRQGQVVSLTQYQYDGLGRTLQQSAPVDGVARVTGSAYDAFDRVTETTLADNAVVYREFAAHSSEDLPILIKVKDSNGNEKKLGEQSFDGLDRRVRAVTGEREQLFSYAPGLFQPASMTNARGQLVNYDYRPELSAEPLHRYLPDAVQAEYEYDQHNALLSHCQEQGEILDREYYSTHELKSETRRSADGVEHQMLYRYSRLGRLLGYTDVLGQEQTCEYDPQGRLQSTRLGSTHARFEYDGLGRLASTLTSDDNSGQQLGTELQYDDFDREVLRLFDLDGTAQSLEQHWNEDDELKQRVLKQDNTQVLRDESYEYDERGRLTYYLCSGPLAPVDPYGKVIDEQIFRFDALDNITRVTTSFSGDSNRADYVYGGLDPVQLTQVKNSHDDYPTVIELSYDDDGNLLSDQAYDAAGGLHNEASWLMTYDALNRLTSVSGPGGGGYRYDPLDKLAGGDGDQRFYNGGTLATRLAYGQSNSWLGGTDTLLADTGKALLATDSQNSVLNELGSTAAPSTYTAYGHRYTLPPSEGGPAFNGAYAEPATGWQLLGNGYRAYNPVLMRFHSPDNLSPLQEGGLNAYAYCEGDPVSGADPSGHMPLRPKMGLPQPRSPSPRRAAPAAAASTPRVEPVAGASTRPTPARQSATASTSGTQPSTRAAPVQGASSGDVARAGRLTAQQIFDARKAARQQAALQANPQQGSPQQANPQQAVQMPRNTASAARSTSRLTPEQKEQIRIWTEKKNAAKTNLEYEKYESKIRKAQGY